MKAFDKEKFCSDIKKLRNKRTQKEISELLGLNRSTWSLIENGKQLPDLDTYQKICSFFGMRPQDYFVERKKDSAAVFMMGALEDCDKEKINDMLERIRLREKYYHLSRGI